VSLPPHREPSQEPESPKVWDIVLSVLAAGFGVQSNKNRERDFKKGSGAVFILVGIVATVLFVLSIYGVVRLVLSNSGM
jgi:hypothetical protein